MASAGSLRCASPKPVMLSNKRPHLLEKLPPGWPIHRERSAENLAYLPSSAGLSAGAAAGFSVDAAGAAGLSVDAAGAASVFPLAPGVPPDLAGAPVAPGPLDLAGAPVASGAGAVALPRFGLSTLRLPSPKILTEAA